MGAGGGFYVTGTCAVNVVNSTFSGNFASGTPGGFGAGIYTDGAGVKAITNCTITGNGSAGNQGSGIFNNAGAGAVNITNSLIAANNGSSGSQDLSGAFASGGFNLIGANSGAGSATGFTDGVNGDQVGTAATPLAPLLGPLADNGGATQTHALLAGSPALDKGKTGAGILTDQRESPRPLELVSIPNATGGDSSDIGAVEMQFTPTLATLAAFTATGYDNGVRLEWRTGFEANNLGFNLYREADGKRALVNPQLVAGSALRADSVSLTGANYQWWDNSSDKHAAYWLEDVDLNGKSTWHGPFYVTSTGGTLSGHHNAELLRERGQVANESGKSVAVERVAGRVQPSSPQAVVQAMSANQPAVKIYIRHEGFYRISGVELFAAGLPVNLDPQNLQLFVAGKEAPMRVSPGKDGRFVESSFIEFYGFGLDTPATDTQVYWLTAGTQVGKRIPQMKASSGQPTNLESFTHTIERKDRLIYFSGLKNGAAENFFGAVITNNQLEQTLTLSRLAAVGNTPELEIALQGVTRQTHSVLVQLNGNALGFIDFNAQERGVKKFAVASSLVNEGVNVVSLMAQNGAGDVSLVEAIRLTYAHRFEAEENRLKFTANGGEQVSVNGFTSKAIRVFDVTEAQAVTELFGEVQEDKQGGYLVQVSPLETGERTLLALADEQTQSAVVGKDYSSDWRDNNQGADLLIMTRRELFPALTVLQSLRQGQGWKVALVDVEDLYDEFNYGAKSPQALKDFLQYARANWKVKPRFVLLAGDASYDPKNYLGSGDFDLVPTGTVDTAFMETASDDWLADFNQDGISDLAIGRLPARTLTEAGVMVKKLVGYEQSQPLNSALLVSDANDGYDFEQASDALKNLLPGTLRIEEIKRGKLDETAAKAQLFDAINRGQKLINYAGHGNVDAWRGNLLTTGEALGLTNQRLGMFVLMTCLNGYFESPDGDSLSESLMKAEQGGAVAVWASSGITGADEQAQINRELVRLIFGAGAKLTVGEAVQRAKRAVTDADIRKTWVLLGDPTMRLK
jgi:hypothetical protein